MPLTEKELIAGFLSKTLNMDVNGVAALYNADGTELNDNALESILTADATRLSKLKPDTKKHFDDGYKKAQSEVASKKEKAISEAVGFETELKGEEFDTALADFVSSKVVAGKDVTEDVVKQHPIFKAREKELLKQLQAEKDSAVAKVEEITKATVRKEALAKVYAKARAEIKKDALLPADEAKAEKQLKLLLLDPIAVYDFDFDGEEITGILKDGVRLEDKHGNAIVFTDFIKNTATENGMEFKVVDPKQSANPGNAGAKPAGKPVVLPKTEQEYAAYVSDSKIAIEDRNAMSEAWKQKANAA